MKHSKCSVRFVILALATFLATSFLNAQQPATVVPALVHFSGVLTNANGKPLTGTVGVTFSLFKDQQGGAPLWLETQNVQPDKTGHYSVMLGSTNSHGLPVELFASGEARWLGLQAQGQPEEPRVLWLSVPYALKALDAETIGGKPASSFMLAPKSGTTTNDNNWPLKSITGSGTKSFIPRFTGKTSIGNSSIFQSTSNNIGIGTSAPASLLDVKGTGDFRDSLTLIPHGSHPALSVQGTAFAVSNAGMVSFVSGQTFPGTGTVTSVGLSAPGSDFSVTGSPITSSGTLGLNWTVAPTATDTANAIVKRDSSGSFNATNINSSGSVIISSGSFQPFAVFTNSSGATGVEGEVTATSGSGWGVLAKSFGDTGTGLLGVELSATSNMTEGAWGVSTSSGGVGVLGMTPLLTLSTTGSKSVGTPTGVWGDIEQGSGVAGVTATADDNFSFWGANNSGSGWPTAFFGNNSTTGQLLWAFGGGGGYLTVDIDGNLFASGSINGSVKNFRIDHPLDPANKYLNHASVESSEMKDIYDGVATFDAGGTATVQLPDWFEALNGNFRYQLTCIGGFSPVYIAREIADHHFTVAGGKPGMKVSWQVTGVRHDAYAQAHPLQVEEEKSQKERGYYVHPELHGASREKSLSAALYPQRLKRKQGMSQDNSKLRSLTKSLNQVRPARP